MTTRSATPFLTFEVCGTTYAIHIEAVVEVAAIVEAASVGPGANPALYGVVIRHGEPLLLVDLRRILNCEEAPVNLDTLFIVIQNNDEYTGFIVDAVAGVVYLDQNKLRLTSGEDSYIRGVLAQENTLLHWLNIAPILADTLPEYE